MTTQVRPLVDVSHDAILVLSRELGIVDTMRFLRQFGAGHGDYTKERAELFKDISLESWVDAARQLDTQTKG